MSGFVAGGTVPSFQAGLFLLGVSATTLKFKFGSKSLSGGGEAGSPLQERPAEHRQCIFLCSWTYIKSTTHGVNISKVRQKVLTTEKVTVMCIFTRGKIVTSNKQYNSKY